MQSTKYSLLFLRGMYLVTLIECLTNRARHATLVHGRAVAGKLFAPMKWTALNCFPQGEQFGGVEVRLQKEFSIWWYWPVLKGYWGLFMAKWAMYPLCSWLVTYLNLQWYYEEPQHPELHYILNVYLRNYPGLAGPRFCFFIITLPLL